MNEYLLDTEHMSSNISRFKNVNVTESVEYKNALTAIERVVLMLFYSNKPELD